MKHLKLFEEYNEPTYWEISQVDFDSSVSGSIVRKWEKKMTADEIVEINKYFDFRTKRLISIVLQ